MVSSTSTHPTLTRRGLLATGGAAGAAAFAALNPGVASAVTAIGEDPAYLRRSSYARLVGQDFTAGGWGSTARLTLADVADLDGLGGRDDAFALRFVGPTGMAGGTYPLSHPVLGSFSLMITPVDPAGRSQGYEAIVNRSEGLTRRAAPRPPRKRQSSPPSGEPPRKLVAHAQLRRGKHGLRCEIVFADRVHARRAHASLMLDGKPVAVAGSRKIRDHRVVLRLTSGRRLGRGRYELFVMAGEGGQRFTVKLR